MPRARRSRNSAKTCCPSEAPWIDPRALRDCDEAIVALLGRGFDKRPDRQSPLRLSVSGAPVVAQSFFETRFGFQFETEAVLGLARGFRVGSRGVRGYARAGTPSRVTSLAMRTIASRLRSTSASVVAEDETLMRMAVFPCHSVIPHQHVPSS